MHRLSQKAGKWAVSSAERATSLLFCKNVRANFELLRGCRTHFPKDRTTRPLCSRNARIGPANMWKHQKPLAGTVSLRSMTSDDSHVEWDMAKHSILGQGYAELEEVLHLVEEKKASDIKVLSASDIEKMAELCEHMVIVTCTGPRHMRIVAEHVAEHYKLKGMLLEGENPDMNMQPPKPEGGDSDEWVLLDLRNIILHIFSPHGRERFALEDHWAKIAAGGYTAEEIERLQEQGVGELSGSSEEELMSGKVR